MKSKVRQAKLRRQHAKRVRLALESQGKKRPTFLELSRETNWESMSDKAHEFLHSSLVCIYAQLLPRIREQGKALGYAIAVHGSMTRDLDLIAVPWTDEVASADELVAMIAENVGGFVIGDSTKNTGTVESTEPTLQPHGRLSWNICWGGRPFIDLSVMPRRLKLPAMVE